MNAAITWTALGLALALLGTPRGAASRRRVTSPRRAGTLAAICAAAGCVATSGAAGVVLAGPVAVALGYAVAFLAARAARPAPDPDLPLVLDLTTAALEAGQPLARALDLAAAAGSAATGAQLRRVARLIALGADPEQVWDDAPAALAGIGAAARRSARTGARLARTLTDLARETRAADRAAALARAQRAGVLALLPLGLCFLPAFVCLGIVPSVAGLLGGVLPP